MPHRASPSSTRRCARCKWCTLKTFTKRPANMRRAWCDAHHTSGTIGEVHVMHARQIHTFPKHHLCNFNHIQTMHGTFCTDYKPHMCLVKENFTCILWLHFKWNYEGKNILDMTKCHAASHVLCHDNPHMRVVKLPACCIAHVFSKQEGCKIKQKKRHKLIVSWPCIDFNGIFKKRSLPACSREFAPPTRWDTPPPQLHTGAPWKSILRALKTILKKNERNATATTQLAA